MSTTQQKPNNEGYSSPKNLNNRLQMLPLVFTTTTLPSILEKPEGDLLPTLQLPPPGSLPPPSLLTLSPRPLPAILTKPRIPPLTLAGIPAAHNNPAAAAAAPASPASQELAISSKPKPKAVETAFGYRVEPAGGAKHSRSSSVSKPSILDGSIGSSISSSSPVRSTAITPRRGSAGGAAAAAAAGTPRRKDSTDSSSSISSSLARRMSDSKGSSAGSSISEGEGIAASRIPLTPRSAAAAAAEAKSAEAFSSSSSSSSSAKQLLERRASLTDSKIPKPPGSPDATTPSKTTAFTTCSSSSRAQPYKPLGDLQEETIFLDCQGDSSSHSAGQGKATFTLSCAVNAVLNVTGTAGSSSSGGGDGMSPGRLLQTVGAALSRGIMSATHHQQQQQQQQQNPNTPRYAEREPMRAAARRSATDCSSNPGSRRSSNPGSRRSSNSNNTTKPAAAATATAAAGAPAASAAAKASKTATGSDAAGASSKAIVPRPSTAAAAAAKNRQQASNTAAGGAAAANAAQAAASIFMQLQGNVTDASSHEKVTAPSRSSLSSFDDCTFHSCCTSEVPSVRSSQNGSEKGQQIFVGRSRSAKSAISGAPSILDNAAMSGAGHSTADVGSEVSRYHSANTIASWSMGSEAGETVVTVDDSEQPNSLAHFLAQQQQQQSGPGGQVTNDESADRALNLAQSCLAPRRHHQQQQQQFESESSVLGSKMLSFEESLKEFEESLRSLETTAAVAAAAEGYPITDTMAFSCPAAATAAAAKPAPPAGAADERAILLTINRKALPFLAAKALSKKPVRLIITQDAVWGEEAVFGPPPAAAAAGGQKSKGGSKKKAGMGGLFGSRRSSRCE